MNRMRICLTHSFCDDIATAFGYYAGRVGVERIAGASGLLDALCEMVSLAPYQGMRFSSGSLRWRPIGSFAAIYHVDDGEGQVTLLRLYNRASRGCAGIFEAGGEELAGPC